MVTVECSAGNYGNGMGTVKCSNYNSEVKTVECSNEDSHM